MRIQEVFDITKDDIKRMEEEFKMHLSSDIWLVGKVSEYILSSGGKRFRPLVMLLCARLCGCKGESHIQLAGVIEFIHTATLLHDDVVDNANLRRGSASANVVWGDGASILVGDYLLSKAFSIAVAGGNMRILEVLSRTTTRMAEGEVMQLLRHADVNSSEKTYLEVITNKTAVLFSAAAEIAAILGGVSHESEAAVAGYGLALGIAYQLMDDCLDYTSNNEDLGKPIGSDLREGKVTLPLIRAFAKATTAERAAIKEAVEAKGLANDGLKNVVSLIDKYGGIRYTLDMAHRYVEDAKKKLDVFKPDVEVIALKAVADYVETRTH